MAPNDSKAPILGIDLGTTHSLAAYIEAGKAKVILDEDGVGLIPSVLAFENGEPIVGRAARAKLAARDPNVLYSTKRLIGKGSKDIDPTLPFDFSASSESIIKMRLGGLDFTPMEVAGYILKNVKKVAENHFGTPVTRAVITVPAYFDDAQRNATRLAGKLAGLEVMRIINEPTAASLAYGLESGGHGYVAVYDLGGGTFDISILELKDGVFEVRSTAGDTRLGGDDLDEALKNLILEKVGWKKGEIDGAFERWLTFRANEAKHQLTDKASVSISLQETEGAPTHEVVITREEFSRVAEPIIQRTLEIAGRAVADSGLALREIDHVVLVGGSTRTPLVKRKVGEFFGKEPEDEINPDEVVACGAALQADVIAGNREDILLLDVIPLSLGIEVMGGIMSKLIPRNSTIPCQATEEFTTYADSQTGLDITVLQGEREMAESNRKLAQFQLKGVPPQPAGIPRIEVRFVVDANGILTVQAAEKKTGVNARVEVNPSYGLTDAEVEAMLMAAMENEESDAKTAKYVDAVTEARIILRATEKNLPNAERLVGAERKEEIVRAYEDLHKACEGAFGEDSGAVRGRMARLNEATQPLAGAMMEDALGALKGRSTGSIEPDHHG